MGLRNIYSEVLSIISVDGRWSSNACRHLDTLTPLIGDMKVVQRQSTCGEAYSVNDVS